MSAGLDALLESLGVQGQLPTPRLFESFFTRFNVQVAIETFTRRAPGTDPDEIALSIAEDGAGVAGFDRARVFEALARRLGFDVRLVGGTPYAAPIARLGGADVLADVNRPLPILLALDPPAVDVPTAVGSVTVRRPGPILTVVSDGLGRTSVRRTIELDAPALDDEPPGSPYLFRAFDDRVVFWNAGELAITDAWSQTRYPLAASGLESVLGFDAGDSGDAADVPATITVYDHVDADPDALRTRLETPEGHLAMQPAGTRAEDVVAADDGWSWTLVSEEGARRRERVAIRSHAIEIESLGDGASVARREIAVEPGEPSGARVALEATLAGPVPPRGISESVRKTLVFHLVSELMGLAKATPP